MSTKGNGNTIKWIRDHQNYQHKDWCLMWPFYRLRGYGSFGYLGKSYYAHRFMCELIHGKPPTDKHQAAHSCGNGHLGCVNPHHLSWKTQSENQLDCRDHGTQGKNLDGNRGRLTPELADEIRAMKGIKTQWQLAEEYRISESTISDIWLNRTWTRPSKIVHWTPEEDALLVEAIGLGYNFTKAAKHVGRPVSAVMGRAYRLGMKSGQPVRKLMP
jgi:hypothetical protein